MFAGENRSNGELLQPGPSLAWGSYHVFTIRASSPSGGTYWFYLDNVFQFSTTVNHALLGHAGFVGEVDSTCTYMSARAYRPVAPLRTLQYMTTGSDGTITQHLFSDHYYTSDSNHV